jgi:hypothetical protein
MVALNNQKKGGYYFSRQSAKNNISKELAQRLKNEFSEK